MWWCTKHKRLSMGSRDLDKDKVHLHVCGCDLTEEQAKEFRIKKKYTFELADGRRIEKVSERWRILNSQSNENKKEEKQDG